MLTIEFLVAKVSKISVITSAWATRARPVCSTHMKMYLMVLSSCSRNYMIFQHRSHFLLNRFTIGKDGYYDGHTLLPVLLFLISNFAIYFEIFLLYETRRNNQSGHFFQVKVSIWT